MRDLHKGGVLQLPVCSPHFGHERCRRPSAVPGALKQSSAEAPVLVPHFVIQALGTGQVQPLPLCSSFASDFCSRPRVSNQCPRRMQGSSVGFASLVCGFGDGCGSLDQDSMARARSLTSAAARTEGDDIGSTRFVFKLTDMSISWWLPAIRFLGRFAF